MVREFDKSDKVATASTAVTVEKVFLRVDVEGGMSVLMQRTESRELGAGTDAMPSPVVPLQVLQQRNTLFEPFEVLTHGRPQFSQRQGMNLGPQIPGEDGGAARKKLILRDAVARARRLADRDRRLAKTDATSRRRAARRGPSIAPQLAA
jgi:hypothetical protein